MAHISWTSLSLVLLWTGISCTSGQPVTNHSANLCVWKGQCGPNPEHEGGTLNCFYNGPPVVATKGGSDGLFELIEANCPWYIDQTTNNTAAVCCDSAQVQTLQVQVKLAQELLSRCPACYKNYMRHFCAITCDPNHALFIDPTMFTPSPSNASVYAVEEVMTYVTTNYANNLYNSCKDVEFSEHSGKVISLLCGTPHCNPPTWLRYMGDPFQNPLTPFLIYYTFVDDPTNTSGLPVGMKPFDVPLYRCNDSDPNIQCMCADCFRPGCPPHERIPNYDDRNKFLYRTVQIILTTKNVSNYTVDFFTGGTQDLVFTMGPVFQMEVLQEVLNLQLKIQNMEVPYTDPSGGIRFITLKDVCFAPIENTYNNNCTIQSVLNYFQNSMDNLNLQQYDPSGFFPMGNASSHIHYCVREPMAPLDPVIPLPCLGEYGEQVDPWIILGGFTSFYSDDDGNPDYDSATVLFVNYLLNNHVRDLENDMAMDWEAQLVDMVRSFNSPFIDISYSADHED